MPTESAEKNVIKSDATPRLHVRGEQIAQRCDTPEGDQVDMKFGEAKQDYLLSLEERYHSGELRATTLTTYRSNLNRYERWLDINGYGDASITESLATLPLRRFLGELAAVHKNCSTSRRNMYGILDGLCTHLTSSRILKRNPMKMIEKPRKSRPVITSATDDQVEALLQAAQRERNPRRATMSCALVATMVYAGLRTSEIVKMQVGDLDFARKKLMIPDGKGGEPSYLMPCPEFFAAMRAWLVEREKLGCKSETLWAHDRNRGISDEWVREHMRDLHVRAGLDGEAVLPHEIRRWLAKRLTKKGGLSVAQRTLRHAQLSTTFGYVLADESDAEALATLGSLDFQLTDVEPVPSGGSVNSSRLDVPSSAVGGDRRDSARTTTVSEYVELRRRRRRW